MRSAFRRGAALLGWATLIARLTADPRSRVLAFAAALTMPVKRRLPFLRHRVWKIRLAIDGGSFTFSDRSELLALEEVFVNHEYALDLPAPPATVVDLGANAGQASRFFRARYPAARIVAVEPDPRTFRHLERNLGSDGNVTLHQCAITTRSGPVGLTRSLDASWMTRVADRGESTVATVQGMTLSDLFAEEGLEHVDLMKVDIEGAELEVLTADPAMRSVGTVIGELHYWMMETEREDAVRAMQVAGGFEHAEFVEHHLFVLRR
jgi:FkbM family methyltransferase